MGISTALASSALSAGGDMLNLYLTSLAAEDDLERDAAYLALEEEKAVQTRELYDALQDTRLVKAALIPRTGDSDAIIRFMFNPTDLQFSRSVSIQMMEGARTQRGLPKVNFGFVEPYQLTVAGLVYDTYETGTSVLDEIQPILNAVDFTSFQDPYTASGEDYQERTVSVDYTSLAVQGLSSATASTLSSVLGASVTLNSYNYSEYGGQDVLSSQAIEIRRPPVFYFVWGQNNYLMCMVESLTYKLTMFLPDGTPVRALVDLTLKEVDLGVADRGLSARQTIVSVST